MTHILDPENVAADYLSRSQNNRLEKQLMTHFTYVRFSQFEFSLTTCNHKATCSVNSFSLLLRHN